MSEKVDQRYKNLEDTFSITMELKRPLLIDEDNNENEEIIKYKRNKLKKNIKIIIAVLLLILTIGTITWISTSYKPGEVAINALVSNNQVDANLDATTPPKECPPITHDSIFLCSFIIFSALLGDNIAKFKGISAIITS